MAEEQFDRILHRTTKACLVQVPIQPSPYARADAIAIIRALEDKVLAHESLDGADLACRYLTRARFWGADLEGADLSDTEMHHADLRAAHLEHANLQNADLSYSNLIGANLTGVALICTRLTGVRLPEQWREQIAGVSSRAAENALLEQIRDKVVENKTGHLNMGDWHTCETTHCLAGWAQFLGEPDTITNYGTADGGQAFAAGCRLIPRGQPLFFRNTDIVLRWLTDRGWLHSDLPPV